MPETDPFMLDRKRSILSIIDIQEKLAAVMTYVRNSFGNKAAPITKEQVAAARAQYKNRKDPFTRAELEAFKK